MGHGSDVATSLLFLNGSGVPCDFLEGWGGGDTHMIWFVASRWSDGVLSVEEGGRLYTATLLAM